MGMTDSSFTTQHKALCWKLLIGLHPQPYPASHSINLGQLGLKSPSLNFISTLQADNNDDGLMLLCKEGDGAIMN